MSDANFRPVVLKFQLGDWTLLRAQFRLSVHAVGLMDDVPEQAEPRPPTQPLPPSSDGFLIRGLPVAQRVDRLQMCGGLLRYVPLQYEHCFIDLGLTFDQYKAKFSSKTRSTIARKVKKYSEFCGGALQWKAFSAPEEIRGFVAAARRVSSLTYQERLHQAGLPDGEEFVRQSERLAEEGALRAYLLCHGDRPVAYLYCPISDGIVIYAYLGYDPNYSQWSVGTVLQWLALESIFAERGLRCFDFTEGQSEHKRLFATHTRRRANVYFVRPTLRNRALLHSHAALDRLSGLLGDALERWGVKAKIRRLMRGGLRRSGNPQ